MRSDPGTVLVQRLRVGRSKMGLIMWRTGWIRSSGLGSHLEELVLVWKIWVIPVFLIHYCNA
ncbi:unnamed protein product, partial [Vitis vinifera]|uniref:Uncharacterized protein n=1 Tax=Vitis vinifera TaxID=29760 RepID=D7UDX2_VITVI